MVFEATGKAASRSAAAIDPNSRAWFIATQRGGVGRDPGGQTYRVLADGTIEPARQPNSPWAIGQYIPQAFLIAIDEDASIVQEVSLENDTWVVRCAPPGGEMLGDAVIRVDDHSGRVLSFELVNPDDRRQIKFAWDESEVGLAEGDGISQRRARAGIEWDLEPRMFAQEQVKSQVLASRMIVDRKLQGILAGYQEDDQGNWTLPDNQEERVHGFADGPVRRYRTPLILAGVMLLGVVLVQIVRRRGGS